MKLLFDQGTPVPLRKYLPEHSAETVYERGWSNISNGDLLKRAEDEGFDALITTDQNLRYQQNMTGRQSSILVLMTTSWPRIKNHLPVLVPAINGLQPGNYLEVPIP